MWVVQGGCSAGKQAGRDGSGQYLAGSNGRLLGTAGATFSPDAQTAHSPTRTAAGTTGRAMILAGTRDSRHGSASDWLGVHTWPHTCLLVLGKVGMDMHVSPGY